MVRGRVPGSLDGHTVAVSQGQVRLVIWPARNHDRQREHDGTVQPDGRLVVMLPRDTLVEVEQGRDVRALAGYLGTYHWASCLSREIRLRR